MRRFTIPDDGRFAQLRGHWTYQGGFTYDELARRFDRPANTVKSWVRRSLARLRRCLEAP